MLEALGRLRSAVIDCADAPVWALSDTDVVTCLDALQQTERALAALTSHLVRQVESRDLPRVQHAHNTAGWLRSRYRVTARVARDSVQVASATDRRPGLDRALVDGAVNAEHVSVIDTCLRSLPAEVGAEAVDKAEALLIGWAADFDAKDLRTLAGRILDHVAPEIAEQAEAKALARQEAAAHAARTLSIMPNGDGRVRLSGWLDTEAAAIVNAALDPLCSPRRPADTGRRLDGDGPSHGMPDGVRDSLVADDRTMGQRRADALIEVCRLVLGTGELPVNGGDRPQIAVTVAFDPLRRELGVGTLDTGHRLTPAATRRLACDAQILPAVLGSDGQILDVGQSRRLISGTLRRALVLRDAGCAFPGCTRPPRWCDGHHIRSWASGGPTSLDNSVLLCGHHHRLIHHSDWTVRLRHDGHPEFLPPAHLDPSRRPRRNLYHRRT